MYDCSGCLEVKAAECLILWGVAPDQMDAFDLLEAIVPPSQLTSLERLKRFKLLTGPYGYTIYKMLEAKQNV